LNNEEDDVATLDFLRRILPFVDHNKRNQTAKEKQRKEHKEKEPTKSTKNQVLFLHRLTKSQPRRRRAKLAFATHSQKTLCGGASYHRYCGYSRERLRLFARRVSSVCD